MNIFLAKIENDSATLLADESWHCCKVLRHKAGDKITVVDGSGLIAECVLELVSEKLCKLRLTQKPLLQKKRNYYLHLAIAPTKQIDRIEWMIEKAVEIGVDELSFIQCKNSERVNIKIDRIHKMVETAMKQSLQAYLPKINQLQLFETCIVNAKENIKLIAHCHEGEKSKLNQFHFKEQSILILIGPEGDFTLDETELANKNQFKTISLGENRLRTETAGLYVCQAIHILTQL